MSDPGLQRQFLAAVAEGDSRLVRELATAGVDVNLPIAGPEGETPLIRAITLEKSELVQLLIELGADVNFPAKGAHSWTPLMFAHDQPDIIRTLIAAGADVNARIRPNSSLPFQNEATVRHEGETALHLAAAAGNAEAVRALLNAGAQVEAIAHNGLAPLDYAIRLGSVTDAALALIEAGAKLTPERLDSMHSSAHSTDSDLVDFPVLTPDIHPDSPGAGLVQNQEHGNGSAAPRCPNCHTLLYSRKARVCGSCGAPVPAEMVMTDEEARALGHQRQWAQDLADKFGPPDPTRRSAASPAQANKSVPGRISPEELLARISCASEFKARPRPAFWLYVIGYGILLLAVAFLTVHVTLLPPATLPIAVGVFVLACWRSWTRASPICPQCHQNIRLCAASYCHVCGQPLRSNRCAACGVGETWLSFFQPYLGGGFRWITYCPGCGVLLEARMRRGLARH